MKVILLVKGCLGGGTKIMKEDIKELFSDEKEYWKEQKGKYKKLCYGRVKG